MGPSATFRWGTDQEKAFDELRQKLIEAPVLHIQIQKMYLSWIQMTRVMLLLLNCYRFRMELFGLGRFIIDSAQRNYCTTRKELLAVV